MAGPGATQQSATIDALEARRSADVETATLVEQARAGDGAAYGTLYRRYRAYVWRIVIDEVGDREARLDISQAVFERALLRLDSLRDPEAFRPWIAQITRNAVVDHHRRSARSVPTDFTDDEFVSDLADDDWSAHDWAIVRELAATVNLAVAGLSDRDKTVIEMASVFGFEAREIAAGLDVTDGHARVLLHRARQRLMRALGDHIGGNQE